MKYLDSGRSGTRSDAHFLSPQDLVTAVIRSVPRVLREDFRSVRQSTRKMPAACTRWYPPSYVCWSINHIGIVCQYIYQP